jgi:hypothetical protein
MAVNYHGICITNVILGKCLEYGISEDNGNDIWHFCKKKFLVFPGLDRTQDLFIYRLFTHTLPLSHSSSSMGIFHTLNSFVVA